MFLNKKAVSEITSFLFLTMIVVSGSIASYFVLSEIMENDVAKYDRDNMFTFLKKLSYDINNIQVFDGSSTSISVYFRTGELRFSGNKANYLSSIEFSGNNEYCEGNVCYYSDGGYERLYLNLSSPYTFKDNLTLTPGYYVLYFKHEKNGSKVQVKIK